MGELTEMLLQAKKMECVSCKGKSPTHTFGGDLLCDDCYNKIGLSMNVEEERLLGIILELQDLVFEITKGFLSPTILKLVCEMDKKLIQAKGLFKEVHKRS